jgi:photosystem II stability/assembly factor-like uncharacterized protein
MKNLIAALAFTICFVGKTNAQWIPTYGPVDGGISSIASAGSVMLASTFEGGGVFASADNGATWAPANKGLLSNYVQELIVCEKSALLACDEGVFVSNDLGASWSLPKPGLPKYVNSMAVYGNSVFAGTYEGVIFVTQDKGVNWKPLTSIKKTPWRLAVTATHIFAGSDCLFISADRGVTWSIDKTVFAAMGPNSLAVNGKTIFAGSTKGLYLSQDNGAGWTQVKNLSGSVSVFAVPAAGINPTLIFARAENGLFVSADNGVNWTAAANSDLNRFTITTIAAGPGGLFAGTDFSGGGIYLSTDRGIHWSARNKGFINSSVWKLFANGTNIFALSNGHIFNSVNNGTDWTRTDKGLADAFVYTLFFSGKNIIAGSDKGRLFSSTDNGATWISSKLPTEREFTQISNLASEGKFLYAGTSEGFFVSADNGANWKAANNGLNINLLEAMAVSDNHIVVATQIGIFLSNDHGANWTLINKTLLNIKSLAVMGQTFFARTPGSAGTLYSSSDNGANWSPVKINLADKGISILAVSGKRLYTASKGRVFKSDDKGATWSSLGEGLPDEDVLSLTVSNGFVFVGVEHAGVYKIRE